MTQRKKQAKARCGTAGVWDRASRERFSEIRSSRQGWESSGVKVLVPPIACSRADSISDACEGNDACSARTYKSQLPCGSIAAVGAIWEASKLKRPEHNGIAAASKRIREKSCSREEREADPLYLWGRPKTLGKNQANALSGTAGVGAQASEEGFTELTSGTSRWQQGLSGNLHRLLKRGYKPKDRRGKGMDA
jgi:hypothetical protein